MASGSHTHQYATSDEDFFHVPLKSLLTRNSFDDNWYNNPIFSDVIVKFGDRNIFAHKLQLAETSQYFHEALTGNSEVCIKMKMCKYPIATTANPTIAGKVTSSQELDLGDEDDPEAIEAMLRFIYGLPYDYNESTEESNKALDFHINVFIVAERYDIESLRLDVCDQLEDILSETVCGKEICDAIEKVCGPSAVLLADESLKETFFSYCTENINDLVMRNESFALLVEDGRLFAAELAGRLVIEVTNAFSTIESQGRIENVNTSEARPSHQGE